MIKTYRVVGGVEWRKATPDELREEFADVIEAPPPASAHEKACARRKVRLKRKKAEGRKKRARRS